MLNDNPNINSVHNKVIFKTKLNTEKKTYFEYYLKSQYTTKKVLHYIYRYS